MSFVAFQLTILAWWLQKQDCFKEPNVSLCFHLHNSCQSDTGQTCKATLSSLSIVKLYQTLQQHSVCSLQISLSNLSSLFAVCDCGGRFANVLVLSLRSLVRTVHRCEQFTQLKHRQENTWAFFKMFNIKPATEERSLSQLLPRAN